MHVEIDAFIPTLHVQAVGKPIYNQKLDGSLFGVVSKSMP